MKLKIIVLLLSLSAIGVVLGQETTDFMTVESGTDEETNQSTEPPPTTTTQLNYCPEIGPYCSCLASPILVRCEGFSDFEDLDFSRLDVTSLLRQRTFELELVPAVPLAFPGDLVVNDLRFDQNAKIILRNMDGFDIITNPFFGIVPNNDLYLYIYESTIRTIEPCDFIALPPDFDGSGLFGSFSYIFFGQNNTYDDNFCPLIFHRTRLTLMEAYYMSPTNYLHFASVVNAPAAYDMETYINQFKITFSPDFIVRRQMLNYYVFGNLNEFNLNNVKLAQIENDAFVHTQRLSRIFLTLENVEEFIRSSDNQWMAALNADVDVDYNNLASLEANRNRTLVIEVNNRNTGQNYSYPDSDLQYYQYFPWDRMVFYRILTDTDIECTETMRFLLQNYMYHEPPSFLNTTSAYKCLLVAEQSTTTTPPGMNYCPELAPQCTCLASPILVLCQDFTDFEELDFKRLNVNSLLRNQTYELELSPVVPLPFDGDLDLTGLRFQPDAKIILRNIDGFSIIVNPFLGLHQGNEMFLYIYDSTIRTLGPCDFRALPPDFDGAGLFASFQYILYGENNTYTNQFCPFIYHKANLTLMEAYYMSLYNYLRFSSIANVPPGYNMDVEIQQFKITYSPDFIVRREMLNYYVFYNLKEFNLDNMRLARIEDDAFVHTQRLNRIYLTLENVEAFIRSSANRWMAALNADVDVDYNNPESLEANRDRTLVIQVNNRNSGQNYGYPDSDIGYYQFFPYYNMVFYRILTDMDLECTQTMRFLVQNAIYHDPVSFMNTTSVYKCLLGELNTLAPKPTTTSAATTTSASTTPTTSTGTPTTTTPSNENTTTPEPTVPLSLFLGLVISLGVLSFLLAVVLIGLIIKICFYPAKPNIFPSDDIIMK